jgi:hypothetical protein
MSIYGRFFAAIYDHMLRELRRAPKWVRPLIVGVARASGRPVDVVDPVDALGVGLDVR